MGIWKGLDPPARMVYTQDMETIAVVMTAFAGGFAAGGITILTMYIRDMEKKK